MSALLPIDAIEMNLCAEYGYSSRKFSKYPMVYQSDNYKSCLFLVYTQYEPINNRIKEYRNHFTLFRNNNSIVICRTETSLIHIDNDATINYDIIKMSINIKDRIRSNYKRKWDVSFDKIMYSNAYPNLVGYSLVCSGEWWFFDRGIILNGLTCYEENKPCQSILIYYELHIDSTIKFPSNDSIVAMQPSFSVKCVNVESTKVKNLNTETNNVVQSQKSTDISQNQQNALKQQQQKKIYVSLLDQLCEIEENIPAKQQSSIPQPMNNSLNPILTKSPNDFIEQLPLNTDLLINDDDDNNNNVQSLSPPSSPIIIPLSSTTQQRTIALEQTIQPLTSTTTKSLLQNENSTKSPQSITQIESTQYQQIDEHQEPQRITLSPQQSYQPPSSLLLPPPPTTPTTTTTQTTTSSSTSTLPNILKDQTYIKSLSNHISPYNITTTSSSPPPQQQQPPQSSLSSTTAAAEQVPTIATIPSAITRPLYMNGILNSPIRQNDTQMAPNVENTAIIPSLYWFDERINELSRGNIEYFLPREYNVCTLQNYTSRSRLMMTPF